MTAIAKDEQALLIKYREAKQQLEALKAKLAEMQEVFNNAEEELIDLLNEQGKEASARYSGVGWVTLSKPRVFANCKIDNYPLLFKYLHNQKRGDLIRKTVNPASLSSFVKEILESSKKKIPPFISYYLKPGLRYFE